MEGISTTLVDDAPVDRTAARRLRGAGCFVADIPLSDPLHLAFLRSPVAGGTLRSVSAEEACAVRGVSAVHTHGDLGAYRSLAVNEVLPLARPLPFRILAAGMIAAVGQPLAAVLAETPAAALDGVEALRPEIDSHAAPGPETVPRILAHRRWSAGDFAQSAMAADHVVEACLTHARVAPSPIEPRGIAVEWSEEGLTIWHSTQTPHRTRLALADILGLPPARLRVIAPDVGGAFGMKSSVCPEEVFAVWAALRYRRSVRWIASRSEEFLSATQGRGIVSRGRLAVSKAGDFLGLEARISAPVGTWLPNSALIPAWNAARILPGGYDIPCLDIETEVRREELGPVGIYRGAGRPEAACLLERLMALAAEATGLDPFEIRARNLLPRAALPHRTVTGSLLDSGNYPGALRRLSDLADAPGARARIAARRAQGRLAGLGLAFYLEPSGEGFETARVTWGADGRVEVASGSSSQGQARETAYAQIAAEVLPVEPSQIEVVHGDTATCPAGIGALASRATPIGGSAVFHACERLLARHMRGEPLPLVEDLRYEVEGAAWGYGAQLAEVEIDHETGAVAVMRVTALDDAGRIINPAFVEGQIRGGFAQGFGEAMMEAVIHGPHGQLLTGSLMDYALPRAADIPPLDVYKTEHPSPMNAIGAKGVGEAGTIGAPAALLNAVLDALAPLGVRHLDMPLTSEKIWRAIRDATEGP